MKEVFYFLFVVMIVSCRSPKEEDIGAFYIPTLIEILDNQFNENPKYISDGFDFPVGKPDGKGYYNAQGFTVNQHLGEDWNALTGGNSDFGNPFYSISHGYVVYTGLPHYTWGKVILVAHQLKNKPYRYIMSLYAHCEKINVQKGDFVKKGEQLGTIGNAEGMYTAHLHLEIRSNMNIGIGSGYSEDIRGYLHPTKYIEANRKL